MSADERSHGCPRCDAPLAVEERPTLACVSCGTTFAVRTIRLGAVKVTKTAGVQRRRYHLEAVEGGDPIRFEGPHDLDLRELEIVRLLYREGAPVALVRGTTLTRLDPAPSVAGRIGRQQVLSPREAALWAAAALAVLALAYLLDTGTIPR